MEGRRDYDFSGVKECGVIRREIIYKHKRGLVSSVLVFGRPGSGKSYFSIRLAELISEDIHGESRITAKNIKTDLLGILHFIMNTKERGEVLIIEEGSVLFGSRRSMSSENVSMGAIMDTIRKKGIILIMNFPIKNDVDSKVTRISSMSIETLSLNKGAGICVVKPLKLQTNPASGKTYNHRLKENGYEVHRCWAGKPSETITEEYEGMKDDYLKKLYETLEAKEKKKTDKVLREIGVLTGKVISFTPKELKTMELIEKGVPYKDIGDLMGITQSAVSKNKARYLEKARQISAKLDENEKITRKKPFAHDIRVRTDLTT